MFDEGSADWISEFPSVTKQYNNTIYHSIKLTPLQASKKSNERKVYSNLQDKRRKLNPKFKLSQLVLLLILNEFSARDIVQIKVINYTQ